MAPQEQLLRVPVAIVSDAIDAEVLSAEPLKARIIGSYGVGFNHIDLDAAKACGFNTAFVKRPDEWGPEGPPDPEPNPIHDIVADTFPDMARQLGVHA